MYGAWRLERPSVSLARDERSGDAMTVVVYGKPDCPLCEKAIAILERLRREFDFHIDYVDITTDPGLFCQYRERIPVVVLDGQEVAWGIVTTPVLRAALIRLSPK
jgi:glutaredoxin